MPPSVPRTAALLIFIAGIGVGLVLGPSADGFATAPTGSASYGRGDAPPAASETANPGDRAPAPHAVPAAEAQSWPLVVRLVDGDTLDAEPVEVTPARWRIRMLAIDTPERDEPGFEAATEALRELVAGRAIRLEYEGEDWATDAFGRLLAYVWTHDEDGEAVLVNAEIVRRGWSRHWTRHGRGRHADALDEAEAQAVAAGRGAWAFEPRPWPHWPEDVHTVREAWLTEIPGIGVATARRIVEYRDTHGPVGPLDDLRNAGLSAAQVETLRAWLHTGRRE